MKRILLFCHDGTGLGHLRRISRIAGALQQRHACLVVSGVREAQWLVPPGCELIKLPTWTAINRSASGRDANAPLLGMTRDELMAFRGSLLSAIAESFNPDAFVVDYLPFGKSGELRKILAQSPARKYLVHRGITDTSDAAILRGAATAEIAAVYNRIMVMADPRVSDLAAADNYCPEAAAKVEYCGYVMPEKPAGAEEASYDVVCVGGGGAGSEELMLACIEAARANPDLSFCIVLGPRSRLVGQRLDVPANALVLGSSGRIPELLARAPVAVCSGGYNSILESVAGGARIVVHPSQRGSDDEQKTFAAQLAQRYPVRLVDDLGALATAVREEFDLFFRHGAAPFPLAANGLTHFCEVVTQDLEQGAI